MKRALLILSLVAAVSFLGTLRLRAEDIDSSYTMIARVAKNDQVDIELSVDLTNNNKDAVIDSYSIFLPFSDIDLHDTKINGKSIGNKFEKVDGGYNVQFSFSDSVILFGSASVVEVDFTPKGNMSEISGLKKLYIPYLNASSSDIKFRIIYPDEFGDLSFNSGKNIVITNSNGYRTMNMKSDKSLFLIWGNNAIYNISSELEVKNSRETEIHYLAPIIAEDPTQSVSYRKIEGGDIGMGDNFGNKFSFVTLAANSSKKFSFSAEVLKDVTKANSPNFDSYDWQLNLDSTTGQKIYSEINKSPDINEKLRNMNNFLSKELKPDSSVNIDFKTLDTVWDRVQSKSTFNSFEYCYLVSATADYLGLKTRIDYGYVMIYPKDSPTSFVPHVWCTVLNGDKEISMDPFLESITGVSYFGLTGIDRIRMGSWDPSQSYNDILGMLGTQNNPITLNNDKDVKDLSGNIDVNLLLNYPSKAFAGEFYSVNMTLKNNSSKVLPIKSLNIAGESQMS